MASEVFWDTSGFFAVLNSDDAAHARAKAWLASVPGRRASVTTEWIIGECCTLLVARKRAHIVPCFLDFTAASRALTIINPEIELITEAKVFLRKRLDQSYSFTDCLSFCLMKRLRMKEAFTTDSHFRTAGFHCLL